MAVVCTGTDYKSAPAGVINGEYTYTDCKSAPRGDWWWCDCKTVRGQRFTSGGIKKT